MKFKVWDSKDKCFVEDEWKDSFVASWKGGLCTASGMGLYSANKRYIIVYSTDQTDKNGAEIYQGDIRQCSVGKYVVEVGPFIYTDPDGIGHHFSGIHKKWIPMSEDNESPFDTEHDKKDLHLGHKLENPELLETGK